MPIYNFTPTVDTVTNGDPSIKINSMTDFNEFNQGAVSEQYPVVAYSVYSQNKEQLSTPLVIDYLKANGDRELFNVVPRIDNYQSADVLNYVEVPRLKCDGLNRFSYNILPFTEASITFYLDKKDTVTQQMKKNMCVMNKAGEKDQAVATIEDLLADNAGNKPNDIIPAISPKCTKSGKVIKEKEKYNYKCVKSNLSQMSVQDRIFLHSDGKRKVNSTPMGTKVVYQNDVQNVDGIKNKSSIGKYALIGLISTIAIYFAYHKLLKK